jgi:NADP-dependent 3-hydroxy acid dehydrogenase YdfG
MDNLREAFEINVQAVQNTTAAFIPLLRKGSLKKVVNM